jgi:hypothetical protein
LWKRVANHASLRKDIKMTFPSILFGLIGIIILLLVVLYFFKSSKTPINQQISSDDEFIIDPETGQFVSVEELINSSNLTVLDEQKIELVFTSLPDGLKARIRQKDVEDILETHYQLMLTETEEDKNDQDIINEMIYNAWQKKGKNITKEEVGLIISLAYPANN